MPRDGFLERAEGPRSHREIARDLCAELKEVSCANSICWSGGYDPDNGHCGAHRPGLRRRNDRWDRRGRRSAASSKISFDLDEFVHRAWYSHLPNAPPRRLGSRTDPGARFPRRECQFTTARRCAIPEEAFAELIVASRTQKGSTESYMVGFPFSLFALSRVSSMIGQKIQRRILERDRPACD
jgi:hypothetical protein